MLDGGWAGDGSVILCLSCQFPLWGVVGKRENQPNGMEHLPVQKLQIQKRDSESFGSNVKPKHHSEDLL